MALLLRYMVTSTRGNFEPITRDENDKRIPGSQQRVNPSDFKGSITMGLLGADGAPLQWEEVEISVTDLALYESFKHGQIRTITIGDPEPATS